MIQHGGDLCPPLAGDLNEKEHSLDTQGFGYGVRDCRNARHKYSAWLESLSCRIASIASNRVDQGVEPFRLIGDALLAFDHSLSPERLCEILILAIAGGGDS